MRILELAHPPTAFRAWLCGALCASSLAGYDGAMWGRDMEVAKYRREFKALGRDHLRHLAQNNAISPKRKQLAAERWLRDQEANAQIREKCTHAVVIFTAIIAFITLLVMLT